MSVIIIPRRHYTQPQGRVAIDWTNSLTTGLIFAASGDSDAVSSAPLTVVRDGLGFKSSALLPTYRAADDTAEFTLIADVEFTSNNGDWTSFDYGHYVSPADNMNVSIGLRGDSNKLYATCRRNSDNITDLGSVTFPYRKVLATAGAIGVGATAYADGVPIGTVAGYGVYAADTRRRISAFSNSSAGKRAHWQYVWKRTLSAMEVAEVSRNPWQLFRADPIRIYSLPSGPISWSSLTASNITQTTATLTLGGITR